jgi:hypothetical protein
MQMHDPFPINSQEDPAVPDNLRDYSYTKPLDPSGADFPCKGYHKQQTSHVSKATYKAGSSYKMTLKPPGAAHGGGSCQLSLSFDNGASFKVIKSMIGGCPTTLEYDFTIPADAPSSGDALFAWTWFNLVGNREMYMNCARVTIQGSAPAGRHRRSQFTERAAAFKDLPDMFTCNIGKGCTTTENQNVAFPNPGSDVAKGDNSMATNSGGGFTGGASGSGDSGKQPAAPAAPSAPSSASPAFPNATSQAGTPPAPAGPTGSVVVIPVSSSAPKPSASAAPAAPAPAAPAAPAPASGSCKSGELVCISKSTWALCTANGSPGSPQPVAPGTACVGGKIGFA